MERIFFGGLIFLRTKILGLNYGVKPFDEFGLGIVWAEKNFGIKQREKFLHFQNFALIYQSMRVELYLVAANF